jgi:hypothetical protein
MAWVAGQFYSRVCIERSSALKTPPKGKTPQGPRLSLRFLAYLRTVMLFNSFTNIHIRIITAEMSTATIPQAQSILGLALHARS